MLKSTQIMECYNFIILQHASSEGFLAGSEQSQQWLTTAKCWELLKIIHITTFSMQYASWVVKLIWNIGKFSGVGRLGKNEILCSKMLDNSKIKGNFQEWENWGKNDKTLK